MSLTLLSARARILPKTLTRVRTMATTSTLISAAIRSDHDELRTYYNNFKNAAGDADAQERWANQFRWTLARHSAGEELVLYPIWGKVFGDRGVKMAEDDRADHLAAKELLYDLERTQVTDPEFRPLFDKLMTELTEHMEKEERDELPALEKAISEDDSVSLAKSFERTKMLVPTRAHPGAPDQPPFETAVGLMSAPLDKLKDLFSKFP